MPGEHIVSMLQDVKAFRQTCMYLNNSSLMPELNWQNSDQDTTKILDQILTQEHTAITCNHRKIIIINSIPKN